jgi:hypothetical protein
MDFESLTRYVLQVARTSNNTSINNLDDFERSLDNIYEVVEERLKQIGYQFKNERELVTFVKFVNFLYTCDMSTNDIICHTDDFLFGYVIPQINKEFDLLRFGENYNINIELKSDITVESQKEQLIKNHFYLNFLTKRTKYFSYSPDISSLIEYDPVTGNFNENVDKSYFKEVICQQVISQYNLEEVDNLFDIKNYLVSPFNDIDRFLGSEYFLTNHQKDIVKEIVEGAEDKRIVGIKGNPGTGKSLLIYHIAKILKQQSKKAIIIHGANLNKGQDELNKQGFNIVSIKSFSTVMKNSNQYDFIIIDEAQRLREGGDYNQLTELTKAMISSNSSFIVSMDGRQILSPDENPSNATLLYDFIKARGEVFGLKNRFRTNPTMSEFIKLLFKRSEQFTKINNKNKKISVKFFYNRKYGDNYLNSKDSQSEWTVLNYTKSLYPRAGEELEKLGDYGENSHEVIGQEFDNVIIPMDTNFYYDERTFVDESKGTSKTYKMLETSDSYYPLDKMLYQNLTRTRERLEIVVIENYELFVEICNLLNMV